MSQHTAWVLVADAQRARILSRPHIDAPWEVLREASIAVTDPPSHLLGSDRPGRSHESMGATRHAIEPRQDPHDAAKLAFAGLLCGRLEAAAREHRFGRLLLVAPPSFLGHLRDALGDAARALLRGTLDKDLTHASLTEVVHHLPQHRPEGLVQNGMR